MSRRVSAFVATRREFVSQKRCRTVPPRFTTRFAIGSCDRVATASRESTTKSWPLEAHVGDAKSLSLITAIVGLAAFGALPAVAVAEGVAELPAGSTPGSTLASFVVYV